MNGIEACKKLIELEKIHNITVPIIGLTGDKSSIDFLNAGATVVFDKPLKHDDLSNIINQFLLTK